MTLHERALNWVAQVIGGYVAHSSVPGKSKDFLGNHYPDVVKERGCRVSDGKEVHEVEALEIPLSRIDEYKRAKGRYLLERDKRKLWIVVPQGTRKAFDVIHIIEEDEINGDFKVIK